jgi:hypothetical protein
MPEFVAHREWDAGFSVIEPIRTALPEDSTKEQPAKQRGPSLKFADSLLAWTRFRATSTAVDTDYP